MKTFNNELTVQRGETFTMQKTFQNKDGSPFIVSSRILNPELLLTVTSSAYDQQGRYLKQYHLSLQDVPRFFSTTPKNVKELYTQDETQCESFDDITYFYVSVTESGIAYEKLGDDMYIVAPRTYVLYQDVNGVREYGYYDATENKVVPYRFNFAKTFLSDDTKDWVEQSYLYSITLVGTNVRKPILAPTKISVLSNLRGEL